MQQIKDTFGSLADKASGMAGDMGDRVGQLTGSDEMKKLMPYLVSGGIGAGAGALLTGGRRKRRGESRTSHLGRVLGNALIAGGLTAGSHALINKGISSTTGKGVKEGLPADTPDDGPLATNLRTAAFSPLTAGAAGAAGLAATNNMGVFGAGNKQKADDLSNFLSKLKAGGTNLNESDLRHMSAKKLQSIVDSVGSASGETETLNKLRQHAGLGAGNTAIGGAVSKLTRQGPLSTFGQTTPRRIGRGALGVAAASLPAVLGALLTKEKEPTNA